jgi:hypothetical protein
MSSTFRWAYAGNVSPGVNPGTGKFSLFVPDGYVNPNYIQFSKTDNTGQDTDSLLSTLLSKTSFVVAVDTSNYIQISLSGSADFGTFYRFNISDSFEIVKLGTFNVDDVTEILDEIPGGGGGGDEGGGGDPPPPEEETDVSWVIVGDFPNKVAHSTNSGRTWTQVTPIVPLSKATCGKKGGSLILIGGEPSLTGGSVYSVESFGDAWTRTTIDLQKCNAIGYNGTEWIAVGKGRTTTECVFTSPDGEVWTAQTNILLEEALNVYWMQNTWIVVGKCFVVGSPCAFIRADIYWVGIDAALIYENLNFDVIKRVMKLGDNLFFIGELEGSIAFGSMNWTDFPTKSSGAVLGSGSVQLVGDLKYNGNYIFSFDSQTKKLVVSSNQGATWTTIDESGTGQEITSDLIIAQATQHPSQSVEMAGLEWFFSQYGFVQSEGGLGGIPEELIKIKGAIDICTSLYNEASTIKVEIEDLKTRLETIHQQVDAFLEIGLPPVLININESKASLTSRLTQEANNWGLPVIGNNLTFDQTGGNFEYITALNVYEENLENYTILVNNVPQLIIDENTLAFLNTFIRKVNEHLEDTERYKNVLQEYTSLLVQRDRLFRDSSYETVILQFNATAESIIEQITSKVERVNAIKTQLDAYVTQIPQMYNDSLEIFGDVNFNLTDTFNSPVFNFGESYIEERPWIINLTRLNIFPFEYSVDYENNTVNVRTTFQSELEATLNAFYERFSGTTFDKDAEEPVFAEIVTLYDEILELQTDCETERDDIIALYDIETIREERQDEITQYDEYPVQGVAQNIPQVLDTYIQRDVDKLDELEETYEQFSDVIQERADAIEALYEEQLERAAARDAQRAAEEAARQAYLQSEEYRAEMEALLKDLEDRNAAQAEIAAQQNAVLLAQQLEAAAEMQKQQAEANAAAAALMAAENEEALRQQEAARIVREERLRKQAERQALIAFFQARDQTFPAIRVVSGRLLYYIYRYFDIEVYRTDLTSHTLFSRIGLSTLSTQTLELINGILGFIRGQFEIYDRQSPISQEELTKAIENYAADVETLKRMVLRVLNSYVTIVPAIQTYIDDIDITTEIAALKSINNVVGTGIETKYNTLKTTITEELENLEMVTSLTLTYSGETLLTQGTTPLGSVLNSPSEREKFFNGITTNIDFQNMIIAKKINAYLIQLNIIVDSVKLIYNTKVYVDQQKTKLTNSRQVILDELSDVITEIFNVDSVDTVFQPVVSAISGLMTALNNRPITTSYTDSTYDETTITNTLGQTLSLDLTARDIIRKLTRQQKAVKDLADFYTEEESILNTGNVILELINFFDARITSATFEVRNIVQEKLFPLFRVAQDNRTNMLGRFNVIATDANLRAISEYNVFEKGDRDTRVVNARRFIDTIRRVSFLGGEYYAKRRQYYLSVVNAINGGAIPYPYATESLDGVDPNGNVQLWSTSVFTSNELQALIRVRGIGNILESLNRVSVETIKQTLIDLENFRLSVVTPLSSQVYLQTLVSEDQATLLQAYKVNARNLVAVLLPTVSVLTFPSTSDIQLFKLQGVTNEIQNTVNILRGYSTQTFETMTIPQIQSSVEYLRSLLIGGLPNLIQNLRNKLDDIIEYKQKVQYYTNLVLELKDAIDRKENIVSNYLNGPTPLNLVMSDGTPKDFIMSIKPTNTNYWEEISGEDQLDYTLFDNNWSYFVGDKVSYNSKVYRVKNATPTVTFESELILSGNPPIFPKTDSTTQFFTVNSNFWAYVSAYQEGTSRPALNQLRAYNGELYKCIKVYLLEQTVGNPPEDPDFWRLIPVINYIFEGAIPYYDSTKLYVEDEEVLFRFQYRSLTNAVAYRLGRFKAVKTASENFPTRFRRPRFEITDTLVPERGVLDENNQVIPDTIPYDMVLAGGNIYNEIPRYGKFDDDPWMISGLLRDLRYSVALGPEMAILYAYTKREQIENEFTHAGETVSSPAEQVFLQNNTPDNAATIWNQIVASYTTQYNRLNVNNGIPSTKPESVEETIRPIYAKAYGAVCAVLDKYVQDITYLVAERNRKKQVLFAVYRNYIEDNAAELFLDSKLSTPGNFVYRDLGIGEQDSIFTDYYLRHKDDYKRINDGISFIMDSTNRMLALDIVDNTLTQQNYNPIPLGGGVLSKSSTLSNFFDVRYHPIGITDWEYVRNTTGNYVNQQSFFDDDPRFPIMRRVKRMLLELAKQPSYIRDTAHLIPVNLSPAMSGLYKVTLGLAIIARAVSMEVFDLSIIPGSTDPLEEIGRTRRAMSTFTRTIQNNVIAGSASVRITEDFLSATASIRTSITTLQENIELLEDTARDLLPEPKVIDPGLPPSLANTVPLPEKPVQTALRDRIADNKSLLDQAKKALEDAKDELRRANTGQTRPPLPGQNMTQIAEGGRTPAPQIVSNIDNKTFIWNGQVIRQTGQAGTGVRRFGDSQFQGIGRPNPATTMAQLKSQASSIADSTASAVSQAETDMLAEIQRRKTAYEELLTAAEKIALDNKEIDIANDTLNKKYEADLQKFNQDYAAAEAANNKAEIDFEKANFDYKQAVRNSDARTAEIAQIRSTNARILAQNEEALAAARTALTNTRNAQRALVLERLSTLSINATRRSVIITNILRRLRVVQFVNTVVIRYGLGALSRAGTAIATSAAGRVAGRIADSAGGRLASQLGGAMIGPAINIGLGFYTAATEGLFDD